MTSIWTRSEYEGDRIATGDGLLPKRIAEKCEVVALLARQYVFGYLGSSLLEPTPAWASVKYPLHESALKTIQVYNKRSGLP